MTIFFELVKRYLETELTNYINESSDYSKGWMAWALGNNALLSEKKRQYAADLRKLIADAESPIDDAETQMKLDALLRECKQKALKSTLDMGCSEGTLERRIDTARDRLERLLSKLIDNHLAKIGCGLIKLSTDPTQLRLDPATIESVLQGRDAVILFESRLFYADVRAKKVDLIKIPESKQSSFDALKSVFESLSPDSYQLANDSGLELIEAVTGCILTAPYDEHQPFSIFRQKMAQYFDKKIDDALNERLLEHKIRQWLDFARMPLEKERVIRLAIIDCWQRLDRLDKAHPEYQQGITVNVTAVLRDLQQANNGVSQRHGVDLSVTMPYTAGLFRLPVGQIQPSDGKLKDCIDEAFRAIAPKEIASELEAERDSTADIALNLT
ncbi:MAG: hypothetical protein A3F46_04360 [Legionellales bacterium RIFCSPHIGHO2_12_FULL_42_9]|nr:MAG: hypothetical protein A3F46_04360 [Legionellales bacterium RIFCSPHIGHO2_12_FULL_42_9]